MNTTSRKNIYIFRGIKKERSTGYGCKIPVMDPGGGGGGGNIVSSGSLELRVKSGEILMPSY